MRILAVLCLTAFGSLAAVAADETAPGTLESARQKSQSDLDSSLRTLSQLRDQIAAEKVPLAKRLSDSAANHHHGRVEQIDHAANGQAGVARASSRGANRDGVRLRNG